MFGLATGIIKQSCPSDGSSSVGAGLSPLECRGADDVRQIGFYLC